MFATLLNFHLFSRVFPEHNWIYPSYLRERQVISGLDGRGLQVRLDAVLGGHPLPPAVVAPAQRKKCIYGCLYPLHMPQQTWSGNNVKIKFRQNFSSKVERLFYRMLSSCVINILASSHFRLRSLSFIILTPSIRLDCNVNESASNNNGIYYMRSFVPKGDKEDRELNMQNIS